MRLVAKAHQIGALFVGRVVAAGGCGWLRRRHTFGTVRRLLTYCQREPFPYGDQLHATSVRLPRSPLTVAGRLTHTAPRLLVVTRVKPAQIPMSPLTVDL